MYQIIVFVVAIGLTACTTPIPKEPVHTAKPILVNAEEMKRVSFEGIHYDIEAGTTIGESRWGSGASYKEELEWTGQKNPNQFNTTVESIFKRYGYDLISYEDRILKFKKNGLSDLKVGIVIYHMFSEQRLSQSYRNRFHKVELSAKIKALGNHDNSLGYENDFHVIAVDLAESRDERVNALPKAVEKLIMQLLSDKNFVAYAAKSN